MRRKKIAFILIFTLTLTIGCYRSDLFNGTLDQVSLLNINSSEMHFAGGDGSAGNPYQVATPAQLNNVRNYPDAHFIQIADIDLNVAPYNSGAGWEPIGNTTSQFIGTYDGANHTITNLYINRSLQDYVGLFGYTDGAIIQNVKLDSVNVQGRNYVGGLLGYTTNVSLRVADPTPVVENCSVTNGNISGTNSVGGLVGYSYGSGYSSYPSIIDHSFAIGVVTGSGSNIGGLVGTNVYSATVSQSFAQTIVSGVSFVGGLVGYSLYGGKILNSYATGIVSGINPATSDNIGGLTGLTENTTGSVTNSYASCVISNSNLSATNIGGLIGSGTGVISSYYDSDVSGQSDTGKGVPTTTAQMLQQTTYSGWDFATTWQIDINVSYPYFLWQGGAYIPVP
jgi:hypothetical protein